MEINLSKTKSDLLVKTLSDSDLGTVVGGTDSFLYGLKETWPYLRRARNGYILGFGVDSARAKAGLGFGVTLFFGFDALLLYGMYKLGTWLVCISEEKPVIKNKKNKNQSNDEV